MNIGVVIPARLCSTRLEKKILADIHGKPLVWWTWKRALSLQGVSKVIVAVDDLLVKKVLDSCGVRAVMTNPRCQNGTERVGEVLAKNHFDAVINIQADEPVFSLAGVNKLITLLKKGRNVNMATLAAPLYEKSEIENPNNVKLLMNETGNALYFSRSVIPYCRDKAQYQLMIRKGVYLKHIGIYGYKRNFLLKTLKLKNTALEDIEKLEQLKYLYYGCNIAVVRGPFDSIGVDTMQDLIKVARILKP